jgi:hypothetical protein
MKRFCWKSTLLENTKQEEVDPEVLLADFFEDISVRVGEEGLSLLFSQSFELGPRFVCLRFSYSTFIGV